MAVIGEIPSDEEMGWETIVSGPNDWAKTRMLTNEDIAECEALGQPCDRWALKMSVNGKQYGIFRDEKPEKRSTEMLMMLIAAADI